MINLQNSSGSLYIYLQHTMIRTLVAHCYYLPKIWLENVGCLMPMFDCLDPELVQMVPVCLFACHTEIHLVLFKSEIM